MRRGPLGQRAAFAYVLATVLVYTVTTAAPGLWNGDPEANPVSWLDWASHVAMVALVAAGTWASYRANGGLGGLDFAARYFALGWVLFIRLSVLLFFPAFLLLFSVTDAVVIRHTDGDFSKRYDRKLWIVEPVTPAAYLPA